MREPVLIIAGSARNCGTTMDLIQSVFAGAHYTITDLALLQIANYQYSAAYPKEDDFLSIVDSMITSRVIVFATPVYWYAMSGLMKVFFDRLTDIVTIQKHLGRQLKGKSIFLLSVGTDAEMPIGFEVPFASTAQYLHMHYKGCLYQSTKYQKAQEVLSKEIAAFVANIKSTNG